MTKGSKYQKDITILNCKICEVNCTILKFIELKAKMDKYTHLIENFNTIFSQSNRTKKISEDKISLNNGINKRPN